MNKTSKDLPHAPCDLTGATTDELIAELSLRRGIVKTTVGIYQPYDLRPKYETNLELLLPDVPMSVLVITPWASSQEVRSMSEPKMSEPNPNSSANANPNPNTYARIESTLIGQLESLTDSIVTNYPTGFDLEKIKSMCEISDALTRLASNWPETRR